MNNEPQLIAIAFAALTGAITTLWIHVTKTTRRLEKKLDECEKDRAELWKQLRTCPIK